MTHGYRVSSINRGSEVRTAFHSIAIAIRLCSIVILTALVPRFGYSQTSQPIRDPSSGHWFEVISTGGAMNWSQARQAAQDRGGYLASITSQTENDFILGLPLPGDGALVGGLEATPGTWTWLSGEPWAYTNWNAGEPNFVTPPEREVALEFYSNNSISPRPPGTWNNIAPSHVSGEWASYIVEYDSQPPPRIPTLSEWGAIIFGTLLLASVAFYIWRRRRVAVA